MRIVIAIGVALTLAGAYVLFHGLSYTDETNVIRFGDFRATVEEKHVVPAWVGAVAVVSGIVLVIGGLRRRTAP